MKIKGLVFSHGTWSDSHLGASTSDGFASPLTDTPRVVCTLATMTALGIERILISVTPESFPAIQSAVHSHFDHRDTQVSYLLSENETSLTALVAQANEFAGQSHLLAMTAGACYVRRHSIKQAKESIGPYRGALEIRMRNAGTGKSAYAPAALVADAKSQKLLLESQTPQLFSQTFAQLVEDLRDLPNFSTVDLGPKAFFVDLMKDKLSAESLVDSDQIFRTFFPVTNS